jgi:electron transport complex protein RnfD
LIRSERIMLVVCACLVPGLLVQAMLFGAAGVAANVAAALAAAALTEWLCLRLRRPDHPAGRRLDASAAVTALIIAAALPPGTPALCGAATALALALGKHAYGGLGNNLFNPAMVGYTLVLVSFPAALASWPSGDAGSTAATIPDTLTGATALTIFRYRGGATVADIWTAGNGFGVLGSLGHEWVALAFGLGGVVVLGLRLAAWRPCVGMLGALSVLSLACYDAGSSRSLGSPLYHLFSGATLLAACFVVTDPVTHPGSRAGQWLFGVLVGTLTFVIRSWGSYPDGIAFAVLLGNALSPLLDRHLAGRASPVHG